jgi:hypothetical protein
MGIMKKILLFTLIFLFTACTSATSFPISTATVQPTATSVPTSTPPITPTITLTPTPTEIPLDPEYRDALVEFGYDKQFPIRMITQSGTNQEIRDQIRCVLDGSSLRKTDFYIGDVLIQRAADCYFLDINGETQKISLPMAFYNQKTDEYGSFSGGYEKGLGIPGDPYVDGTISDYISRAPEIARSMDSSYAFFGFTINDFYKVPSPYFEFSQNAPHIFSIATDIFYDTGDISEFKDEANAENFIFPSVAFFIIESK